MCIYIYIYIYIVQCLPFPKPVALRGERVVELACALFCSCLSALASGSADTSGTCRECYCKRCHSHTVCAGTARARTELKSARTA